MWSDQHNCKKSLNFHVKQKLSNATCFKLLLKSIHFNFSFGYIKGIFYHWFWTSFIVKAFYDDDDGDIDDVDDVDKKDDGFC